MAKIDVFCPKCGHRHEWETWGGPRWTVAGVSTSQVSKKQFTHTIAVPGELIENDRYYSIADQLLLSGAVGLSFGAVAGFIVGQAIYTLTGLDVTIQAPLCGAVAGLLYMFRFLYLERTWQWFERIPQAVNTYLHLSDNSRTNEGVTLTVDHKHRDSFTEAGRSIALLGVLPVSVEDFAEWARCALRGDSLAIANWTGSSKLFSRLDYDNLLGKMREANIVAKVDGKGHKLTNPGRHALKAAIDSLPPYPPPQECA